MQGPVRRWVPSKTSHGRHRLRLKDTAVEIPSLPLQEQSTDYLSQLSRSIKVIVREGRVTHWPKRWLCEARVMLASLYSVNLFCANHVHDQYRNERNVMLTPEVAVLDVDTAAVEESVVSAATGMHAVKR